MRIALRLIAKRPHAARANVCKPIQGCNGIDWNALPAQIFVYERVAETVRQRVCKNARQPHEHGLSKIVEHIRSCAIRKRHLERRDVKPAG